MRGRWERPEPAFATPLGLPLGLQLYSVRELLPKDYDGTLQKLGALGYREVEAAGFFDHSASEVKQAMGRAGLNCVGAHYSLEKLQPQLDEIIQFGKDLGPRIYYLRGADGEGCGCGQQGALDA